jgi:hypothetical protein
MSAALGLTSYAVAQPVVSPTIQSVTMQPNPVVPAPTLVREDSGPPFQTGLGYHTLWNSDWGQLNTAVGFAALEENFGSGNNTAIGAFALQLNDSTQSGNAGANTATGSWALYANFDGAGNTATGSDALSNNTTGNFNTALGFAAGGNATTGSYNLFLGAVVYGDAADTNTIRIGLPYDSGTGAGQNQTFIAGIYGTPLSGTAHAVYVDANGQLGTVAVGGGGGVLPMSQLQQQVDDQRKQLRDQDAVNAELRARLAKLEALLASAARRK